MFALQDKNSKGLDRPSLVFRTRDQPSKGVAGKADIEKIIRVRRIFRV